MLNKVLFIDDDSVALMLNGKLVEKTLFAKKTVTALNGKLGLDYLNKLLSDQKHSTFPELIFLDLNMPVMDGWDFLDRFSDLAFPEGKQSKVIVLSSSINPEDLERSKNHAVVIDFIPKPVTVEILERLKERFSNMT
jgi:CheY-like chemotaxis protein